MRKKRRRVSRGFTLVEMAVTVGILGILTGSAIWTLNNNKETRDANASARDLTSMLRSARQLTLSRADTKALGGSAPKAPSGGPLAPKKSSMILSGGGKPMMGSPIAPAKVSLVHVVASEIRAFGPAQLQTVAIMSDGSEKAVEVLDLDAKYPDARLRLADPRVVIRFNGDGTLNLSSAQKIEIIAADGSLRTLEVSLAGKATMR